MNEEERNKRDEELWYICENYLFMGMRNKDVEVDSREVTNAINVIRLYEGGYDLETSINIIELLNTQVKIKKWNSYCKKTNRKDINLLSHNDFIARIEKSKQTLEKHQFNAQRKFSLSKYTDVTGRKMKCYKLSREGIRHMLGKESDIIQHILMTYLSYLEEEYLIIPDDYYTIGYLWHLGYRQYFDTELLKRTAYKLGRVNVQEEGSNGKIYNAYHKDVYLNAYGIEL